MLTIRFFCLSGAAVGIWLQGYLSQKIGLKRSIIGFFLFTAALMIGFSFLSGDMVILAAFAFIGFGVQGGFIGMYSMAARLYPTEFRSAGIGGAIGAGRTGAIASPIIGGQLVAMGMGIAGTFLFFSVPLLMVGGVIWKLKSKDID